MLGFNLGPPELLIILLVLLLLFGATRLPQLARSIGQSTKEFKKGMKEGAGADEEAAGQNAPEDRDPATTEKPTE